MVTQKAYRGTIVPLSRAGAEVIISCAVLSVLATFWVGLRFYSRRIKHVRIQQEDYMIVAALASMYLTTISILSMVFFGGMGHHISELEPFHLHRLMKISFALQIFCAISLGLVKCSICTFLVRIFFASSFKIAAYIAMGLSIAWAAFTILTGLVICHPLAMFWDPTTPGGYCGNQIAAFSAGGAVDVVTDVFIFILPIRMVWQLRVPWANKVALACIFALGIFTITVGALRTIFITRMSFADITYSIQLPTILGITEIGVAIVVASSPALRPLFDRIFHGMSSITNTALEKVSGRRNEKDTLERSGDQANKLEARLHEADAVTTEFSDVTKSGMVHEDEEMDVKSISSSPTSRHMYQVDALLKQEMNSAERHAPKRAPISSRFKNQFQHTIPQLVASTEAEEDVSDPLNEVGIM